MYTKETKWVVFSLTTPVVWTLWTSSELLIHVVCRLHLCPNAPDVPLNHPKLSSYSCDFSSFISHLNAEYHHSLKTEKWVPAFLSTLTSHLTYLPSIAVLFPLFPLPLSWFRVSFKYLFNKFLHNAYYVSSNDLSSVKILTYLIHKTLWSFLNFNSQMRKLRMPTKHSLTTQ